MTAEEIWAWSCSSSILGDSKFIEQTKQSLVKRMLKLYSENGFLRVRSDVDVLFSSLEKGEDLGKIREKMFELNIDLLDSQGKDNRRVEVDTFLKWAYVAFTSHHSEMRVIL